MHLNQQEPHALGCPGPKPLRLIDACFLPAPCVSWSQRHPAQSRAIKLMELQRFISHKYPEMGQQRWYLNAPKLKLTPMVVVSSSLMLAVNLLYFQPIINTSSTFTEKLDRQSRVFLLPSNMLLAELSQIYLDLSAGEVFFFPHTFRNI